MANLFRRQQYQTKYLCKVTNIEFKQKNIRLLMAFFRGTIWLNRCHVMSDKSLQTFSVFVSAGESILRDQMKLIHYKAKSTKYECQPV